MVTHVLSLKSIWNQLKKENKNIVIMHMQILCALTQEYFIFVSKNMKN